MEMHQVRYFLAAVSELNFTKAADKCNVSQPSLTRAVKQLEDELGGDLFRRERPNTDPGPRLLNDYEIASRLSYFLWGSMPDKTLFDLASQGKLQGWIVGALPLFLGVVLWFMEKDSMRPLVTTWWGWVVVGVIVIMEAIGAFMIKKIVTIDV